MAFSNPTPTPFFDSKKREIRSLKFRNSHLLCRCFFVEISTQIFLSFKKNFWNSGFRWKLWVFIFSLLLLGTSPGLTQNSTSSSAAKILETIRSRGTLRVGLEGTYPPFSYVDANGKLVGFEVDFANAVATQLGVKAVFQPTPWDGLLGALESGRVDVVINQVMITPERKKVYDFSDPYTISGIQIIIRKSEAEKIAKPADLAGKRVGVGLGTNYATWLAKNVPTAIAVTYTEDAARYEDLLYGRIDASLNDRVNVAIQVHRSNGAFVAAGPPFHSMPSGIVLRKSPAFQAALNRAIDTLRANEKLAQISKKWFHSDLTVDETHAASLPPGIALIFQSLPFLLKGLAYTVGLSLGSMILGLILATGLALARLSSSRILSHLARVYISFFRGTPLLVQLFLIYYGLPQFGLLLSPIAAALIGLSLNLAAYASEILRAAILAIDSGQWEAASVIGLSPIRTLQRVILPQAARIALPPLGNTFIGLVKDTSLAATIQVPELFRQSQLITARTFEIFAMYLATAGIYWLVSSVLSALQNHLEERTSRYTRRAV